MSLKPRGIFSTRASALPSLFVSISFLVITLVYACSGLKLLHLNSHNVAMSHESVERGPCSEHKEDICASVRDRMLALQPSLSQGVQVQTLAIISSQITVDSILSSATLAEAFDWKHFYDPVLKPSLSIAFPFLRI